MSPVLKAEAAPTAVGKPRRRRNRIRFADRTTIAVMLAVPLAVHVAFVWVPALASVVLSFTQWDGIGALTAEDWVGVENYRTATTAYPPFWPAFAHNVIWLVVFIAFPTVLGILLAVLLDRKIRGSAFYESAIYLPVVLSMALIGFMTQLIWSPDQGAVNSMLGAESPADQIDWLGDPSLNLPVVILMASWRHAGYIMVLYLAGLKSVDTSLREAATIDGAGPVRTFIQVVFPALKPINIVILVITVIESLRAFDIVYVVNRGRNGLELLSVLVTNNLLGEAGRIGFGSAIAVVLLVISLGSIITYLWQMLWRDRSAGSPRSRAGGGRS